MTILIDLMLSYAFHGKLKTDLAALRKAIGPEAVMIIDSGAFTVHSTGQTVKIEDYAAYLRDWQGVYDGAITLDVIGDEAGTRRNLDKLWSMGLKVLPVHNSNGTLAELDRLLDETDWLAIGGMASGGPKDPRIRRRFVAGVVAKARRRGVACHCLGMSSARMLRACAPFSCDVSTPARSLLHGTISIYVPSMGRTEQVVPKDHKYVSKMRQELADHDIRPSDLLNGNVFEDKDRRNNLVRGASFGLAAMASDVRKRSVAPPPTRLAGRAPGPRVLNALVTDDNVQTVLDMVLDGEPIEPIPRIARSRM